MSSISTSSRQPTSLNKRPHLPSKAAAGSSNSKLKTTRNNYVDLKIVIRLLPSNLSEQEFYDQLKVYHPADLPVKYYVQGEAPRTPYDNPKYSRAYIKFRNVHELDEFLNNVRGKPFVESDTSDSVIPTVEKSLYNKMPEIQRKRTKRGSTLLDDDPLFKAFANHLEDPSIPFGLISPKNGNKNRRKRNDKNKKSKNKEIESKKQGKEVENVKHDENDTKTKPKRGRNSKKKDKNDENLDSKKEIVNVGKKKDGEVDKSDNKSDKDGGPKRRRRRRPKKEESGENNIKTNDTKSNANKPNDSTNPEPKIEKKTSGDAPKSEKPKKDKPEDSKRSNKPKNKSLKPKKLTDGNEQPATN